jgi:hypothetical protein
MLKRLLLLSGVAGLAACVAQEYEISAAAGYGFSRNASITRGSETATTGFRRGFAASVAAGNQMHRYLGGELRYTYRDNDPKVSSGGQDFTFPGKAHIVHYDALLGPASSESRVQPYIAFGGGIKIYQGTGTEQEFQPLERFAVLTKTQEVLPMVSLGAGVRFRIANHAFLRFDFRDYLTPFPSRVIMPAPGAALSGWMHDFTPMVGISASF